MSSALCVFIHSSETGHTEGVPIAPSRGRSVEVPFGREQHFAAILPPTGLESLPDSVQALNYFSSINMILICHFFTFTLHLLSMLVSINIPKANHNGFCHFCIPYASDSYIENKN